MGKTVKTKYLLHWIDGEGTEHFLLIEKDDEQLRAEARRIGNEGGTHIIAYRATPY